MGPFQGFGPNWDQVQNLGPQYEHCSCYLDSFISETKFSKTETETFFRDQILRNRNPQKIGKSLETEKFETKMSISDAAPDGKPYSTNSVLFSTLFKKPEAVEAMSNIP